MSSQAITLSFNDLKTITSQPLAQKISSETAVEVTLKSLKEREISELEIYKTWATSLFKSYGTSGINNNHLTQLLDAFSFLVQELLKEGDCQDEEQIGRLHEFLNYTLDLLTWIHSVAVEFDTNEVSAFLCFALAAIKSYLDFLSKQSNRVKARKLIEKSLVIHSVVLSVLTEQPKTFFFNDNEHLLSNLISGLCDVAEVTLKLDIKAAVETWKSITRLASLNAIHRQTDGEVDWLKRPMSFLMNEIGRNVQTVYTQNSLNEPIEQVEKYLKVTNFYLRLLHKLATDFRHLHFPIGEELVSALVVVFNPPAYIANSPVNKVIRELIGKDLKELVPFAYRNDVFFEHLLSEHSANIHTKEAIFETILNVIEVIIRKSESEYMNELLLDSAFKSVTESAHIYGSSSKYNRFIELISAFHSLFCTDLVQKKLINIILQEDTLQALAAIDIWCTTFRLSDDPVRLSHLKFWTNIYEGFLKFTNRVPALHVELILRNLFKIALKCEMNFVPPRNERFLQAIRLDAIPNCAEKQSIIQHFVSELMSLLQCSINPITVNQYYMIIKNLKLLSTVPLQNDRLIEILLQSLKDAIQNRKLFLLVESILEFIGPKIEFIDESRIFEILTTLRTNISSLEEHSTKASVIEFLKTVAKSQSRFESQSKEILKAFEGDESVKFFGCMEEMRNYGGSADKRDDLWKEFIENRPLEKSKKTHVCRTRVHVASKRNTQKDIEILLENLQKTANNLQTQADLQKLNSDDKEIIKKVVCKLQSIGSM